MRQAVILAAILVSGCSSLVATNLARERVGTFPPEAAGVPSALAAAGEVEIEIVYLPSLSSWPRSLRAKGPMYALYKFSPYVGQLGVLKDYKRADSGIGFLGVAVGYRKPLSGAKAMSFEFIFEQSAHTNESSDVDATATRLLGAVRLNMKMDEKLTPFVVAGGGRYSLEFDELNSKFNLSGLGIMLGGGVDFAPNTGFFVRAELAVHIWDAAEESGNGGRAITPTIGIGAAVSF